MYWTDCLDFQLLTRRAEIVQEGKIKVVVEVTLTRKTKPEKVKVRTIPNQILVAVVENLAVVGIADSQISSKNFSKSF